MCVCARASGEHSAQAPARAKKQAASCFGGRARASEQKKETAREKKADDTQHTGTGARVCARPRGDETSRETPLVPLVRLLLGPGLLVIERLWARTRGRVVERRRRRGGVSRVAGTERKLWLVCVVCACVCARGVCRAAKSSAASELFQNSAASHRCRAPASQQQDAAEARCESGEQQRVGPRARPHNRRTDTHTHTQ